MSAILGLAGLAYTLNHGIYKSDLTPWLEERFFVLFHEMDYNERSARIIRIIQEDVIHNKSISLIIKNINSLIEHVID